MQPDNTNFTIFDECHAPQFNVCTCEIDHIMLYPPEVQKLIWSTVEQYHPPFSNSKFYNFGTPINTKPNFIEQHKQDSTSLLSISYVSENPSEAASNTNACSEKITNEIHLPEITFRHDETNTHFGSTSQQRQCAEELQIDLVSTHSDTKKV